MAKKEQQKGRGGTRNWTSLQFLLVVIIALLIGIGLGFYYVAEV